MQPVVSANLAGKESLIHRQALAFTNSIHTTLNNTYSNKKLVLESK
jgi:hypothetical protein